MIDRETAAPAATIIALNRVAVFCVPEADVPDKRSVEVVSVERNEAGAQRLTDGQQTVREAS